MSKSKESDSSDPRRFVDTLDDVPMRGRANGLEDAHGLEKMLAGLKKHHEQCSELETDRGKDAILAKGKNSSYKEEVSKEKKERGSCVIS